MKVMLDFKGIFLIFILFPHNCFITGVAEIILRTQKKLSLKCLSAKVIKKNGISYKGQVPRHLEAFIELHGPGHVDILTTRPSKSDHRLWGFCSGSYVVFGLLMQVLNSAASCLILMKTHLSFEKVVSAVAVFPDLGSIVFASVWDATYIQIFLDLEIHVVIVLSNPKLHILHLSCQMLSYFDSCRSVSLEPNFKRTITSAAENKFFTW